MIGYIFGWLDGVVTVFISVLSYVVEFSSRFYSMNRNSDHDIVVCMVFIRTKIVSVDSAFLIKVFVGFRFCLRLSQAIFFDHFTSRRGRGQFLVFTSGDRYFINSDGVKDVIF